MTPAAAALLTLLGALALPPPAQAQAAPIAPVAGRTQAGGVNHAPRPGLYSVVLVDAKVGRIRVRDLEGKLIDANVAPGAYDLSKLKIGDKIRIDFAAQDDLKTRPTAAVIWPAN
jgi:hypothetical protein